MRYIASFDFKFNSKLQIHTEHISAFISSQYNYNGISPEKIGCCVERVYTNMQMRRVRRACLPVLICNAQRYKVPVNRCGVIP